MKHYKKSMRLCALIIFVISTSFINSNPSSSLGGWVKLGEQTVSPGADSDELAISAEEKTFKRLKFKVLKAPIYIRNITIIYNDGTSENHIITRQFDKGKSSRVFDLMGHRRIITKILFNYTSRNISRGEANLVVMAKN